MFEEIIKKIRDSTEQKYPPVSEVIVTSAEEIIGFSLPPLLSKIYREIGNGGFGPGHGILGLDGGHTNSTGDTSLELYRIFLLPDPEDQLWFWPKGLFPFCDWGCAIYSCICCFDKNYAVKWFDPNGHLPNSEWSDSFIDHTTSFDEWIMSWLNGINLFDNLRKTK